jgi:uncharacterized protein (DUF1800 family)
MTRAKTLSLGSAAAGLALVFLSAGFAGAQETPVDRDQIIHVLNRITFGPRPGDVEMVEQMGGVRAYIEQQLHPEQIDDSAVDQQVANLDLLQMSPQQLVDIYKTEKEQQKLKKQEKVADAAANGATAPAATLPANPAPGAPMTMQTQQGAPAAPTMEEQAGPVITPPAQPPAALAREKLKALLDGNRTSAVVGQLQQDKLIRAIESKRQLQEVLVDFWGNHFNIDVKKNFDRILKVADDRDVIRPHIFGKFRDLLEASAKSPAMLVYLDNALSTVPRTVSAREQKITQRIHDAMMANGNEALAPPVPAVGEKKGGINENYGREIMELHTLGVDGGYTQKDVQEVARCFTGWSVDRLTGEFQYHPRAHDNGSKIVLGHFIPANGGMQDGETVLDILASSPATAHHIAYEMCQRFVSDDPPSALVDRVAGVFTQTNGDLRQVTEAILTSPEFLSPSDYNTKIKSPLEFAVSAVRASGSTITTGQQTGMMEKMITTMEGSGTLGREAAIDRANKRPRQSLNWHIYDLGEPLFACAPPTGYTEVSRSWVNPGALIERLNFALALTEQKVSDVTFDPQTIFTGIDLDKPDAVLDRGVSVLLQDHISDSTKRVLEQTVMTAPGDSKTINPTKLVALLIGSPDFQRK